MTSSEQQKKKKGLKGGLLKRVSDLYLQGAMSMRLGKTLWKIIAVKLFVIFFIFKFFFFPDFLEEHFRTDSQRADHVMNVLTNVSGPARLPCTAQTACRR